MRATTTLRNSESIDTSLQPAYEHLLRADKAISPNGGNLLWTARHNVAECLVMLDYLARDGQVVAPSRFPDRVRLERYDAEQLREVIGEIEKGYFMPQSDTDSQPKKKPWYRLGF